VGGPLIGQSPVIGKNQNWRIIKIYQKLKMFKKAISSRIL
jgi:hypothetical protein